MFIEGIVTRRDEEDFRKQRKRKLQIIPGLRKAVGADPFASFFTN